MQLRAQRAHRRPHIAKRVRRLQQVVDERRVPQHLDPQPPRRNRDRHLRPRPPQRLIHRRHMHATPQRQQVFEHQHARRLSRRDTRPRPQPTFSRKQRPSRHSRRRTPRAQAQVPAVSACLSIIQSGTDRSPLSVVRCPLPVLRFTGAPHSRSTENGQRSTPVPRFQPEPCTHGQRRTVNGQRPADAFTPGKLPSTPRRRLHAHPNFRPPPRLIDL